MTKRPEPEHINGASSNLEQRVKEIFCEIVDQSMDGDDCETRLEQACQGNEQLRARVLELLSAYRRADQILNLPPVPNMLGTNPEQVGTSESESQSETDRREDILLALCGSQIGPYKILERLGEGGMGIVFLAQQHEPLRRKVALKVVKPGMDSRQILARFDVERQALALMDHPHIAKVLDAGVTDSGRPYFAMEYVKGLPITKYCDQVRLTIEERLRLFVQVCQAVQHAHQKGIIHRDLKPSNILICQYDGKPVPKVIDFGLAKALHQPLTEQSLHTAHGLMVGTPRYMSPEQAEFNNLDVDTRSDIYSLGVVLYELLTGSTPLEKEQFKDVAIQEMLRLIKEVDPQKPSTRISSSENRVSVAAQRGVEPKQLSRHVHGELDWIVMKSLDKERHRRYETANALARDIERYLVNEPVEACPPTINYRIRKLIQRNKGLMIGAASVFMSLLIGLLGVAWQSRQIRIERDATAIERDRAWEAEQLAEIRLEEAIAARQREADRATAERIAREAESYQQQYAQSLLGFLINDLLGLTSATKQALDNDREFYPLSKDSSLGDLLHRASLKLENRQDLVPPIEAGLRRIIGESLQSIGENALAIPHLERALELFRADLDPYDRLVLDCARSLAYAYRDHGMFPEAISLGKEILTKWEEAVDKNHPFTINAMIYLASTYRETGQLDEALNLSQQAVDLADASLEKDHSIRLRSIAELASVMMAKGTHVQALPLLKEVYQLRLDRWGSNHPETLNSLNALAEGFRGAGDLNQTLKHLEQLLEWSTELLEPNHPKTLKAMNDLAQTYLSVGRIQEAILLQERVLELTRAQNGAAHPNTLIAINNLGLTYRRGNQGARAVEMHEEAFRLMTETLGPSHPNTLRTMVNLGASYRDIGELERALEVLLNAHQLTAEHLGASHPITGVALNALCMVYRDLGQLEEALNRCHEFLLLQLKAVGPDHPSTLSSRTTLASIQRQLEQFDQAIDNYKQVIERRQALFGERDAVTLNLKHDLAMVYWDQRNLDASIPLFEEIVDWNERERGASHRTTIKAMINLGVNYQNADRLDEGIESLQRALAILDQQDDEWAKSEQLRTLRHLRLAYVRSRQMEAVFGVIEREMPLARELHLTNAAAHAQWIVEIAENLFEMGEYAKSEAVWRDALQMRSHSLSEGDWKIANTQSRLGESLLAQGRFEEAEPSLIAGFEGLSDSSETPRKPEDRLREAAERLVVLYSKWHELDSTAGHDVKREHWQGVLDAVSVVD